MSKLTKKRVKKVKTTNTVWLSTDSAAVGEEPGQQVRRELGDDGAGPGVGEPVAEPGDVPAVLPNGVRRTAIGGELAEERLEGFLELHDPI